MFSDFTSQIVSWIGKVDDDEEEIFSTPTENSDEHIDHVKNSPTKTPNSVNLDIFSNVKCQVEEIGEWLGSSISILKKVDKEGNVVEKQDQQTAFETTGLPIPESLSDNDVNNPCDTNETHYITESPAEDKEDQFDSVPEKALAGAKSFANFVYSAINKASTKIKKSIKESGILEEFNREEDEFIKDKGDIVTSASPPWIGYANEETLKNECLSLSTDRRNFLRSPPAGIECEFDYEVSYPVAIAIMEEDPNLRAVRYELVPKLIKEEHFWRNYFYRLNLICQANELSYYSTESDSTTEINIPDQLESRRGKEALEFVSDTLQTSSKDLNEVREGMKKLNLGSSYSEDDLDMDLEDELQDYKSASEQVYNSKNDNWEDDLEELAFDEKILNC